MLNIVIGAADIALGTVTKSIAMTTIQKTLSLATVVAMVGVGIYSTHRAWRLNDEVQSLRRQQSERDLQIEQLQRERDDTASRLALLTEENTSLKIGSAELLKLRNEVAQLRRTQALAELSSPQDAAIAAPSAQDIGRELGAAVVRGDAGALEKIAALSRAELQSFNTNRIGLNETLRGELAYETFAPLRAAFAVITDAAMQGNHLALDALMRAIQIPELNGPTIQSLGALAGNGSEGALEALAHPEKYGLVLSGTVGALESAAGSGNQKAIDALAAVTRDPGNQALWFMAAQGLSKAADLGNETAIDALIGLLSGTNQNVQSVTIAGLKKAAANQNAKAVEALRLQFDERPLH